MDLVVWVSNEYSARLWKRRCEVEVEEGRCQQSKRRQVIEEMRAEGKRVAGLLGWDYNRVKEHFGEERSAVQIKQSERLVKRKLKNRTNEDHCLVKHEDHFQFRPH